MTWATLAVALTFYGCIGDSGSRVADRNGAKGRIQGSLLDAETGAPVSDATVETQELGNKVSTTTKDGFFTLDKLTAGGSYRVVITKDGYLTRNFTASIPQVPQDAYDAVGIANVGQLQMNKGNGTLKGRVEFVNQGQATVPLKGAPIVVDYTSSFPLVLTTTSSDTGEFTLTGLPTASTGFSGTVCALNIDLDGDGVPEYLPSCQSFQAYPNQTSYIAIRPQRVDLNLGDANLVQGVVRDAVSRLPIAGVEVAEVGKEPNKVTTDANGYYFYKTTTVNKFMQLVFTKATYADGYMEFSNIGRGGNNTGSNLSLSPGGASVVGRLTYANFLPAKQAEVRVDLRSSGYNYFQSVKTNDTGDFALTNLPGLPDGFTFSVRITPWSADPDLFPETATQNLNVTTYPGAPTPLLYQLNSSASLQLVAYNFYSGFIGTAEPVSLEFSLPLIPGESTYQLQDNNSGTPMPYTVAYADNNRRVTITPNVATGQPLWSENRSYRIQWNVRANNGPSGLFTNSLTFTPRTSLAGANIAGHLGAVTVDTPDIDATSRTFTLRWPPLPDAFSYSVYLRTANTLRLPSYVRINSATATPSPTVSINLGALSGSLTSTIEPANGQPFAFGQVLSFLVVPVDSRGIEADATKGASLDLRDVVPPRFDYGIAQLDGAAGATQVRFVVRGTEPLDRNTPPTTTLPTGLTVGPWVVDETTGGVEGTLTLLGSLSATANLSVQLRDTSGNIGRALTVPVQLNPFIPNTGFEGSTCSSSGWTAETNTTCASCTNQAFSSQPAAASNVSGTLSVYEGTCALAFGDPDATFCGLQSIYAPLDLTGTTFDHRDLTIQYRYWPYYSSGTVRTRCDLFDNVGMSTLRTFHDTTTNSSQRQWTTYSSDLTSMVGRTGRLRCQLDTQSTCGSRGGVQMDDFRLYLK